MATRRILSANPARRAHELLLLTWSAIWIAAITLLTLTRAFGGWGDLGHLAIGIGLSAPIWLIPAIRPSAPERALPWSERHSTRFNLWIGLFSLLQVYFGSDLFFDLLGMEYRFPVRLVLHRTPLFLYFLTIAYFSTYYTVMSVALRAFDDRVPRAPRALRALSLCLLGYGVAFAETASMANPLLAPYFSYRDKSFALLVGSLCYGSLFVVSLPFVRRLDEPGHDGGGRGPRTLAGVAWEVLAVNMLALVVYEAWRHLLSRG